MARLARVVVPDLPHHLVQRGVRSQDVFFSDRDRLRYLAYIGKCAKRYGVTFWAWCLMDNHTHFIAIPRTFGEAHRRYTTSINLRQGVKGHLFQERFYSYPVQSDTHLAAVGRYIERNPVKARIAVDASKYRWSSAAYNLGLADRDPLLTSPVLNEMFYPWEDVFETQGRQDSRIEKHLRTGRPFGDARWIRMLERRTGRSLALKKRGRRPSVG